MTSKPQKMFNVRFNIIAGKNIVVSRNQAFDLGEVGGYIWELCDGEHTIEGIAEAVTREYAVDYSHALSDCQEFIKDLQTRGLLQ